MNRKEVVMQKIEDMVCDAVSSVMRQYKRSVIGTEELYIGKKNIPLARSIARNFCFHIMHFYYGFTYPVIAQRAGMTEKSVMRCVRKYHQYTMSDPLYIEIRSVVKKTIGNEQ